MRATIAWWDLTGSAQTIDSLRSRLRDDEVRSWSDVPGLLLKFWIFDRSGNRWGAVMLWEPGFPRDDQPLPPNLARELIGYAPTERIRYEVAALA